MVLAQQYKQHEVCVTYPNCRSMTQGHSHLIHEGVGEIGPHLSKITCLRSCGWQMAVKSGNFKNISKTSRAVVQGRGLSPLPLRHTCFFLPDTLHSLPAYVSPCASLLNFYLPSPPVISVLSAQPPYVQTGSDVHLLHPSATHRVQPCDRASLTTAISFPNSEKKQ